MMKITFSKLSVITAVVLVLSTFYTASAIPARQGTRVFIQPDGSRFTGKCIGDEFFRLRTTDAGEAIVRDSEGWWCYAGFDPEGGRYSSGVRVGTPDNAARTASRMIPYELLMRKASEKRAEAAVEFARGRESLSRSISQTKAGGTEQQRGIIVLAQYSDVKFKNTRTDFVNMITSPGYSFNGATGSAADYFNDQFGGSIKFTFDISEIVTLPKTRKYYGGNTTVADDENVREMIEEACRRASQAGTDFSLYDNDGDGFVENVFVFFAGEDEAETENTDCIWSHAWSLESPLSLNGTKISRYACTAELTCELDRYGTVTKSYLAGIGTFCHEFSHTLGVMDLYDTDYTDSGGQSEAEWHITALMDGGNMNNNGNTPPNWNAVDWDTIGGGNCMELTPGRHTLRPIHENRDYYKLETDYSGEYYLFECRNENSAWDKYCGGSGLLVYHIDRSKRSSVSATYGNLTSAARWDYNEVNCRRDRQCADLVEADRTLRSKYFSGLQFTCNPYYNDTHKAAVRRIFFPAGADHLDADSGLDWWSGNKSTTRIDNITLEPDGSVSFIVYGTGKGSATIIPSVVFPDGALVEVICPDADGTIRISYALGDSAAESVEVEAYDKEKGRYAAVIEGLESSSNYTLSVSYSDGEMEYVSSTEKFKTLTSNNREIETIFTDVEDRMEDGSFAKGSSMPLHLNNAGTAASIEWFFNSEEITAGADCLWTIPSSGELKAVATYEDGRKVNVYKTISVNR